MINFEDAKKEFKECYHIEIKDIQNTIDCLEQTLKNINLDLELFEKCMSFNQEILDYKNKKKELSDKRKKSIFNFLNKKNKEEIKLDLDFEAFLKKNNLSCLVKFSKIPTIYRITEIVGFENEDERLFCQYKDKYIEMPDCILNKRKLEIESKIQNAKMKKINAMLLLGLLEQQNEEFFDKIKEND